MIYQLMNGVGLNAFVHRLLSPEAAILMCHSLGPAQTGFAPNRQWTLSEPAFRAAVEQGIQAGYEPTRLSDMASVNQPQRPNKRALCVTFDDGYRDNLLVAAPACQALAVPMTVFVTSGLIARTHTAWWHFLESLLRENPTIDAVIDGGKQRLNCATQREKHQLYERLSRHLMSLDAQGQQRFVDAVANPARDAAIEYAQSLFLDRSQLAELAALPHVELGLHGVSHAAFSRLSDRQVRNELTEGLSLLQSVAPQATYPLAYPHGSPGTFGPTHQQIAAELGIRIAVTTTHGSVRRWANTDPMQTPRLPLFPDDDNASLQAKFSGLSTLLARLRVTATRTAQA